MGFGNIAIRRVVCTCAVLFFKQNFACIQTTFTHQVAHILGLHTCTTLLQSRIILKLAPHATSSMGLLKSGGAGGVGALVSYKFCEAEKVEKTCQRNSPV